jgi:hypothetical protein
MDTGSCCRERLYCMYIYDGCLSTGIVFLRRQRLGYLQYRTLETWKRLGYLPYRTGWVETRIDFLFRESAK